MNKAKRITIAGFGGQGVMMIGQMLAYAGNEADLNSLWFPSYGPETRGGTANCSVTLSPTLINSPVFSKADTLIIMNKPSLTKFWDKIIVNGTLLYNSSLITEPVVRNDCQVYGIPVVDLALELGNVKVANMIILGAYLYLNPDFNDEIIKKVLEKILGEDKQHLVDINIKAIQLGKDYIAKLVK
ncbi:MAG TPA: 2-oxoacid:acceptor oxidoreductase family protein [Bacilli bacterium]|nr:2-oxoacid:acceptor oxidoreductase family protein [Bacilli bacterium]HPX84130.1 2-oxoacid:acceptor oxidoreductase family protein [Bacilli bacterium]HQC74435.1 2-oxoacid:acceptor oxidoreductase family protein [Bacilli bacterium]